MKKRILSLLALVIVIAFTVLPAFASLGDGEQRVFDDYDLLTDEEEERLEQAISYMRGKYGYDFVILTSDANTNGYSTRDFADDFYDINGFAPSGILYFIDMAQREFIFTTAGDCIPYFTDDRVEYVLGSADAYISRGDYYSTFAAMMSACEQCFDSGIPESWDDYGNHYGDYGGDYYPDRSNAFPTGASVCSAIVFALTSLIKNKSVKTDYGMLGSTYRYNVEANTEVEITDSRDEYIRSDVIRIPRDTGRSGHSGGSGHVSTHVSSHGVSHGGGGHHF